MLIENFATVGSKGAGPAGRASPSPSMESITPPAVRKELSGGGGPAAHGVTIRAMPSLSVSGVQAGEVRFEKNNFFLFTFDIVFFLL